MRRPTASASPTSRSPRASSTWRWKSCWRGRRNERSGYSAPLLLSAPDTPFDHRSHRPVRPDVFGQHRFQVGTVVVGVLRLGEEAVPVAAGADEVVGDRLICGGI